jgi:glycosyltransferase involved in cell wall biosynthesis
MKTKHVLAFVEGLDHVCYRYRIGAFLSRLEALGTQVTVRPFRHDVKGRLAQFRDVRDFDAVLVQRKLLPGWQFTVLRQLARYLVFDFDDAVMYRDSYHPKGIFSHRRWMWFRRQADRYDCLVAGNSWLATHVRELHVFRPRVEVIPTCVDPAKYPVKQVGSNEGPCRLVWVGSSSTLQGLVRDRPSWDVLGREVSGLVMRVVCDRFPELGDLKVEPVAWSEATEAQAIAECDVGVSFLPEDRWSEGKCGLKTLQYMACGLPVVANLWGVNPVMVRPDVTGSLVHGIEERYEAILALRDGPGLRARLGRNAREKVEKEYSLDVWAGPLSRALGPV